MYLSESSLTLPSELAGSSNLIQHTFISNVLLNKISKLLHII